MNWFQGNEMTAHIGQPTGSTGTYPSTGAGKMKAPPGCVKGCLALVSGSRPDRNFVNGWHIRGGT